MKDDFGNRMKFYENLGVNQFMPLVPVCARMDGKCFSKWTKGLKRPYDKDMSDLMVATTKYLVEETGALIGYTQSDEISLLFYSDNIKKQIFFGGRVQKMISILSAMTTAFFNEQVSSFIPSKSGEIALFDSRVWSVPTKAEAVNTFLWREMDATRNSISMAAHSLFSHKQLQGKNRKEMQDMLVLEKNINWNDYPSFFKRGTYIQKKKTLRAFSVNELEKLPKNHDARKNPNLIVERSEVKGIYLPPINSIENKIGVVFNGEEPIKKAEN